MDYALFCAAALVLFAASQAGAWHGYRNMRLLVGCTLLCVLILTAGWFVVEAAGDHAQRFVENLLRGYASTYAAEMKVLGHAALTLSTPADDPRYLAIIEAEKRWLSANPRIADVYTFRQLADGKIVLIADSETDYDRNGKLEGAREQRTPLGEVYNQATDVWISALQGQAGFDHQIVTDRWGTWVSAFEPIRNSDGSVESVLGIDFEAQQFLSLVRWARFTAMGYLAVLVGLTSGASFIIGKLSSALRRTQAVEAELTRARDTVCKSEQRIRRMVENANEAISIWDKHGNVLLSTEASTRVHGYSFEKLKGTNVLGLIHEDDRSRLRSVLERVSEAPGKRETTTARVRHKDGHWCLCEGVFTNLIDDPAVEGIVANYHDITEREWVLEALRRSEERYRNVFESVRDAFFTISPTGLVTARNSAAALLSGVPDEEILNSSFVPFIAPEDLPLASEMFARAAAGERVEPFEVRVLGKTGIVHMEFSLTPQFEDGTVVSIIGVGRDLSQRRALEEQLRQAQKMDCVGQLAGGIAHDFNNLLTVVSVNASMIPLEPGVTHAVVEMAKEIGEAANRAANLNRQLLTFSRHHLVEADDIDLNQVVSELLKMLRRLIGENIDLHFDSAAHLPAVYADAGMIEQVLVNLSINARDAMPDGGHLRISTAECHLSAEKAHLMAGGRAGHFVCLCVTDTGTGIAPEHLPHLFEPFYTTKDIGKGTGLGLATVYGIIKQHQGWIHVRSEPGRGAEFVIYLPVSAKKKETPKAPKGDEPPIASGTETILVVEDEVGVRNVVRVMLNRLGYHVLEAASGAEALCVWEKHREQIDILFTDIVMPGGMSGVQLAARLQEENPALKVLFTSGYSPKATRADVHLEAGKNYLQKPYPPDRLAATIRAVLEGSELACTAVGV